MEDTGTLLTTTLGEIERILNTKTVIGDPITLNGTTVIPLVNVGFGFGAGSGTGKAPGQKREGAGGGAGGGGGVKPVAVLIANKEGVRIESLKGATASLAEKVVDTVGQVIEKRSEKAEKKAES